MTQSIKSTRTINAHRTVKWRLPDGKLHREDGPAIEWGNGDRSWYRNGKIHREDGPAIKRVDGYEVWYRNGELHREDGPAVEHPDGRKEWYICGIGLTLTEDLKTNHPILYDQILIYQVMTR
jgi:hypothetical protein